MEVVCGQSARKERKKEGSLINIRGEYLREKCLELHNAGRISFMVHRGKKTERRRERLSKRGKRKEKRKV